MEIQRAGREPGTGEEAVGMAVDQAAADTCPLQLASRYLVDVMFRDLTDPQLMHQFLCPAVDLLTLFPASAVSGLISR
mgnify:CR=1 FL=1